MQLSHDSGEKDIRRYILTRNFTPVEKEACFIWNGLRLLFRTIRRFSIILGRTATLNEKTLKLHVAFLDLPYDVGNKTMSLNMHIFSDVTEID